MRYVPWFLAFLFFALGSLATVVLFLRDFYRIRGSGETVWHLLSFLIRRAEENNNLLLREGRIINPESPMARVGGPGYAVIFEDSAAVFEQYGRLTRVLGPGYYRLEPYERVRGVVDLRPQTRRVQVAGFTRDGIPVRGEVEIEFQIRQLTRIKPEQGAQESQRFRSFYTFSWEGVLNAVYNAPVRNGDVVPPGEMITEEVSYWFRRIVESYNFEELIGFYPEESPSERVRLAPQDSVRLLEQRLLCALRNPLRRWGYQVNRLQINSLEASEEVREKVKDKSFGLWRALRLAQLKGYEAEAEASTIRIKSEVRADVEALFLNSLIAEIVEIEKRTPKGLDGQTLAAVACLNVMESLLSSIKEESQFLIPSWVWEQMDRLKKTLALPIP
jgi:regulator of protease activity HflC (stomatin/prohibitin superfamily)